MQNSIPGQTCTGDRANSGLKHRIDRLSSLVETTRGINNKTYDLRMKMEGPTTEAPADDKPKLSPSGILGSIDELLNELESEQNCSLNHLNALEELI